MALVQVFCILFVCVCDTRRLGFARGARTRDAQIDETPGSGISILDGSIRRQVCSPPGPIWGGVDLDGTRPGFLRSRTAATSRRWGIGGWGAGGGFPMGRGRMGRQDADCA